MKESLALKKFKDGLNCAQSVLYHCAEKAGIDTNTAVKAATGFGGGMGRMQEVCGAVTGGILAINYRHGRNENEEKKAQDKAYEKVRNLFQEFEKENGSCLCKTLLKGVDLKTEEGHRMMKEKNMIEVCYKCVDSAARIMDSIL